MATNLVVSVAIFVVLWVGNRMPMPNLVIKWGGIFGVAGLSLFALVLAYCSLLLVAQKNTRAAVLGPPQPVVLRLLLAMSIGVVWIGVTHRSVLAALFGTLLLAIAISGMAWRRRQLSSDVQKRESVK
jgi:hypothetical protein